MENQNKLNYKNIIKLKKNIQKYLTLRKYIIILGCLSFLFALSNKPLTAFVLALLFIMGLIVLDKYKEKIDM